VADRLSAGLGVREFISGTGSETPYVVSIRIWWFVHAGEAGFEFVNAGDLRSGSSVKNATPTAVIKMAFQTLAGAFASGWQKGPVSSVVTLYCHCR
jgi:hypothetical protein